MSMKDKEETEKNPLLLLLVIFVQLYRIAHSSELNMSDISHSEVRTYNLLNVFLTASLWS